MPDDNPPFSTFNEQHLHAALKQWYAESDARPVVGFEVPVAGYVIDLVLAAMTSDAGDLLVEIQTGSFAKLKRKLPALLDAGHQVRLVHPVAREKWLLKLPKHERGKPERRKSPKRGRVEDVFAELVSFPHLLAHPGFSLEVVLTQEEEIRRHDPAKAWRRRGWVIERRRLLDVVARRLFETPAELAALLPPDLAEPFTTAALAEALMLPRRTAQQMCYCLRGMGAIAQDGKQGRAYRYRRA